MGLGNIDGWGLYWDMVLLLVGAISMMPFVCEVEISLCWDSHVGLSSLEVLALQHRHRLPILDLAFVEAEV